MTVILSAGVGISFGDHWFRDSITNVELRAYFKSLTVSFCYTETLDSPDAATKIPPYQLR